MDPVAEKIALSRGVNRDGACHRYPKAERTQREHWCGEHRAAPIEKVKAA